jgi:hypothetical protein
MFGLLAWLALAFQPGHAQAAQGSNTDCPSSPLLRFEQDALLGHTVVSEAVPEMSLSTDSGLWTAHPCYFAYRFIGYPYPNAYDRGQAIYLFPVRSSYQSLYPPGSEDMWLARVNDLRATLSARPTWKPPTWQAGEMLSSPPLLPPINAANIYLAKQRYITLPDGAGVRYISYITQDVSAPSPEDTFYMFQGLLDDKVNGRQYYVSAVFPVFLSSPPAFTPAGDDSYMVYVRQMIDALGNADNADFNVDLSRLDKVVSSIVLVPSPSSSIPGMPATGGGNLLGPFIAAILAAVFTMLAGGAALRLYSRATSNIEETRQ